MEFQKVSQQTYYFQAAVNIGYVQFSEEKGMLIDAGLEDQTMKKVLKKLKESNLPLTHLFITHAHADHYGGAAYLQKNQEVYTIAPAFEAAILQEPMLEPLYLFHGANPLSEWRSKFLEGRPIQVDLVLREEGDLYLEGIQLHTLSLPGHSYQQFGVMVEDILFAADAYFGIDILHKHGIPFIVDAKQTMETLEKLKKLPCKGMVPGHGSFEQDYLHTINENIQVHQQIEEDILQIIKSEPAGIPLEKLVARACTYKKLLIRNASSFMLFRTAVTAYLTKMMQEKKVIFQVRDNQLLVESSSE